MPESIYWFSASEGNLLASKISRWATRRRMLESVCIGWIGRIELRV